MARPKAKASGGEKRPRQQHPFLVGMSDDEAALAKRGAAKLKMPTITFIRDAALYHAREALGLKQPGEG